MSLYDDYMQGLPTLQSLQPKSKGKTLSLLVLLLIVVAGLVLYFTPWVQTSQGMGTVSTLIPQDRTQAISALVPGQIRQWHVREGQRVSKGDPIVTLADQDPQLVARLESELMAVQQQRDANIIAVAAAEQELQRKQALLEQGLVSVRERDEAQIKVQAARTKLASANAEVNQSQTRLARQSTQTKYAPTDGVIARLLNAGPATYIKAGDVLASFIPNDVERAVVIEINGLDAPLVMPGREVRLQFDGWPVFQFSGWPSLAVGTFAGTVEFVEPVATASGRFRVWVKEDASEYPWPSADAVRLGSRARGWILLEEVRLGYEIWRQLNNFPPKYPAEPIEGASNGSK